MNGQNGGRIANPVSLNGVILKGGARFPPHPWSVMPVPDYGFLLLGIPDFSHFFLCQQHQR